MIFIYRFLTFFFYPILIVLIYFRKLLNKEDHYRYKEKIFPSNFFPEKDNKKKLIWFHAASIGETQSIFPLIQKLNTEIEDVEFLVTTTTLSAGNIIAKKLYNYKNIKHRYFPIDVNFLIKIFLNKWQPNLIIFVDSEIWPNLIFEIKKRKIPVALINGRITKKTFNKWMLVSTFAKEVFNSFDLCLASSKDSEDNLRKLNVKNLKFIGNIKFSGKIIKDNLIDKNLEILKQKKHWCAASTHRGEEIVVLKTHLNLKKIYNDLITIIIPRHISRSNEINKLCNNYKLSSQILNDRELIDEKNEIIIINSFGSLHKFYNYSKSVFMGKSMIKKLQKVGGQNPIEAAKLGCKIYHGPHVYNFKEIYDLLNSYKISEEINNVAELSEKLANDLKELKNNKNKITDSINDMGDKILSNTTEEIKKYLM